MTKANKKREKFIKEKKKNGFGFKPIYIIGLLLIGGIAAIMLFGGDEPEEPQPIPPTPPPSPPSGRCWAGERQSCT